MENRTRTALELETTRNLLELVTQEYGDLPTRVVAGALMRTSVLLAVELLGPESGGKASRIALETVLSDCNYRRKLLQ